MERIAESIEARYGEHISCRPACSECCRAGLTVVLVEAVVIGESLKIPEERILLQAGQPPLTEEGSCAMLTLDGLCRIYKHHPILCRTHGLPLRYEENEIIICYKNFLVREPHESALIDMQDINTQLFNANFDYCRKRGLNPMARVAIDRIFQLMTEIKKKIKTSVDPV
jgi:Fe-S-cluster containining protein